MRARRWTSPGRRAARARKAGDKVLAPGPRRAGELRQLIQWRRVVGRARPRLASGEAREVGERGARRRAAAERGREFRGTTATRRARPEARAARGRARTDAAAGARSSHPAGRRRPARRRRRSAPLAARDRVPAICRRPDGRRPARPPPSRRRGCRRTTPRGLPRRAEHTTAHRCLETDIDRYR